MGILNWSDDFQTGGENHAVEKMAEGLKLAVKPVLEFHGATYYGDRIRVPASISLDTNSPWSLVIDVVLNDVDRGTPLLEYASGSAPGDSIWNWKQGVPGGYGVLSANLFDETGQQFWINSPDGALLKGQRALLVGTYDGRFLRVFKNGVLLGQADIGAKDPRTAFDLYIGYRIPGLLAYRSMDGLVHVASVWAKALSEAEQQGLRYRVPKPDEPGLRAYWFLDEGSGTQAGDLSVNANHGTLEGPSQTQLPAWVAGEKRMGVRFLTLDLSTVDVAQSSRIEWTATVPSGTGVTIETNLSLDGGVTWQGWAACTNGAAIPGIVPSTDSSNARLKVWEHLHTKDPTVEPVLHSLTITINSAVSVALRRRAIPVFRPGRIHPVPHRGRVYPLA